MVDKFRAFFPRDFLKLTSYYLRETEGDSIPQNIPFFGLYVKSRLSLVNKSSLKWFRA